MHFQRTQYPWLLLASTLVVMAPGIAAARQRGVAGDAPLVSLLLIPTDWTLAKALEEAVGWFVLPGCGGPLDLAIQGEPW